MSAEIDPTDKAEEPVAAILWEFATHAFLITSAFLVIFSFAVLINQFAVLLITKNLLVERSYLHRILELAASVIVTVDVTLLIILTVKRGARAAQKF